MGFFDDQNNVEEYLSIAEGYDGRELIELMKRYVPAGSTILELGMGPGKDLDILNETYRATGTDSSRVFIDMYREKHPEADVFLLDAVTLETNRRFQAVYSNKVLMHLTREQMFRSLERQAAILDDPGIMFHSLWKGEGEEEHQDLRFVYYSEDELRAELSNTFDILDIREYEEMEPGDSLYIVLKVNS